MQGLEMEFDQTSARAQLLQRTKFPFCKDISKFVDLIKIGEGTYGQVYKARDKETNRHVAMKKIISGGEFEGFPLTAIREIKILKVLKHENIVELIEVCRTMPIKENNYKSSFYLILEFCEHDLAGLLANKSVIFTKSETKMILKQLLEGLFYIHSNKVLHRDLKPANILVNKKGILKLADFGLARPISERKTRLTNKVVTIWYRPPEILLGDTKYGHNIDMWGVGCIMAELYTRHPIFQGNTDQRQLQLISQICGSITLENWKGVKHLPLFNKIQLPQGMRRKVTESFKPYLRDEQGCDLLEKLLTLDPSVRIDTGKALDHEFFWTDPMPVSLERVMLQHKQSMFQFLTQNNRKQNAEHPGKSLLTKAQTASDDSGYQDIVF